MANTAHKLSSNETHQEIGVVESIDGGYRVRSDAGTYDAQRAVGCLVAPEVDDVVLLATTNRGVCYLLSVLEREDDAVRIELDGDLAVSLRNGEFKVAAQDGVKVVSGKDVDIVSGRFNLNALDGNIVLRRLTYLGDVVRSEIGKVWSVVGLFDSVMERLTQKVKRSYRTVEEYERVKARQLDYSAEKTLRMHGENTLMTAKKLFKMDGEQIHIG